MRRTLHQDIDGAIVVLGLVMAVFLVALLYYAIGVGDAIMYRESMQDGADASAYSAAIIHARGMNMIVMFNIIMAALLAILVALKLISTVAIVVIGLLSIAAVYGCGPLCTKAIPTVRKTRTAVDKAYDVLKKPILMVLEALHCGEIGLRYGIPVISQARTLAEISPAYKPPVRLGVIWPIYAQLPVEDDAFDTLCTKAGQYAGELASIPFQSIGIGFIIKEPIAALAKTFPSYFCGASMGAGDPPSYEWAKKVPKPGLGTPAYEDCYNEESSSENPDEACAQAERELEESFPQGEEAACENALCEKRLSDGRRNCEPKQGRDLKGYMWYERDVTRYYTKDKMNRVYELTAKRAYGPSILIGRSNSAASGEMTMPTGSKSPPPCGQKQTLGGSALQNNVRSDWTTWNLDLSEPVCHEKFKTPEQFKIGTGEEIAVKYKEIQHVVGCVEQVKRKVEVDETLGSKVPVPDSIQVEGAGDGEGTSSESISCFTHDDAARSPQRVLESAVQGEEDFQLRSIVIGKRPKDQTRPLLRLAAWGKETESFSTSLAKTLQNASVLSLAQAEFFFNGKDDRGEWMWHMRWRARLRRFRMPSGQSESERESITDSPSGACFQSEESEGDTCSSMDDDLLGTINELILH
ncbi:MAG: Tad domain-containing protein [Myxococcales bacterium]|nr:Tad domain-containing protein [Myxococcales bacterium]MCB9707392.1 Tad domain-containing protein [Myxococcales bacterium]